MGNGDFVGFDKLLWWKIILHIMEVWCLHRKKKKAIRPRHVLLAVGEFLCTSSVWKHQACEHSDEFLLPHSDFYLALANVFSVRESCMKQTRQIYLLNRVYWKRVFSNWLQESQGFIGYWKNMSHMNNSLEVYIFKCRIYMT